MTHLKLLLMLLVISLSGQTFAQLVSTIAGVLETPGFNDGKALSSRFFNPHGIATDAAGNIYVADRYNHTIRKIAVNGQVTTMAGKPGFSGSADGEGEVARFNEPWGICASKEGIIYVADTKNNKIRRVDADGRVSTLAGTGNFGSSNGQGLATTFGNPTGIELDEFGNLYVADHLTHIIRKIDTKGVVTTIAGIPYIPGDSDGFGREAQFWRPYGLSLDNEGNILVADEWNHKIRSVTPAGEVSTIAGTGEVGIFNGSTEDASFNYPWDITVDGEGNIYVADGYNYVIRKIGVDGTVSSYAGIPLTSGGVDGVGSQASFSGATSIAWDEMTGSLYIGDAYNHLVRMITTESKPSLRLIANTDKEQICQGESFAVQANTNAFSNYAFYIDEVLAQNSESPQFAASNMEVGSHQIKVEAYWEEELLSSNILSVEVLPSLGPSISVVGETTFYEGDSTILIANGTGDFLWSNGATTQTITVRNSGNYSVQVLSDEEGCSNQSEAINIDVLKIPVAANITVEGSEVLCSGESTTLFSNYTTGNQWLRDGWVIADATESELVVTEAGFYQVQIQDPTTEVLLFSDAVEITSITNQSIIDFEANTKAIQPGEVVTFTVTQNPIENNDIEATPNPTGNTITYDWNFGDGTIGETTENPSHQYTQEGNFTVILSIQNVWGCRDTITKLNYIEVAKAGDLFIPTAFTPNGDGFNDFFLVRGPNLQSFTIQIYDQWGGQLFSNKKQEEGWDGQYNGQDVNAGTYTYLMSYNVEGKRKCLSGHITLLR